MVKPIVLCLTLVWSQGPDLKGPIGVLTRPDGPVEAKRQAVEQLVFKGSTALIPLLDAMGTEDIIAANWFRSAFEKILAQAKSTPPLDDLLAYAKDTTRNSRARKLALAAVDRHRPGTESSVLEKALDDPAFSLEAIDRLLLRIKAQPKDDWKPALQTAWMASRDPSQMRQIAALLKSAGQAVDLPGRLGLVRSWQIIGPFEDPDYQGFTTVYPPEQRFDPKGSYPGKSGPVTWKQVQGSEQDGKVDLSQAIGPVEGAVAYAVARIEFDQPTRAVLMAGADDNLAIWVNGTKVFSQGSYHGHFRADWYQAPAEFPKGTSTILLKVCQAPPKPDKGPGPPNKWEFALRITDASGLGAAMKIHPAMNPENQGR